MPNTRLNAPSQLRNFGADKIPWNSTKVDLEARTLLDAMEEMAVSWKNDNEGLIKEFGDFKTGIQDGYEGFKQDLTDDFDNFINEANKNIKDYKKVIKENFDEFTGEIDEAYELFTSGINKSFSEHKIDSDKEFNDFKTGIINDFDGFKTTMLEDFVEFKNVLELLAEKVSFDNNTSNTLSPLPATNEAALPSFLTATNVKTAIEELTRHIGTLRRRTASITLDFTTDELNGNQTLTQLIDRRLQDNTLFVNNDTFYALVININPGTSTTSSLRLHGLKMKNAYVEVNINNGVTLALAQFYWNHVGYLLIRNHATQINGNFQVMHNIAEYGRVEVDWNAATVAAPAAPRERLHSVITGGMTISRNIVTTDVIYRQGGNTELGVVDAHGRVNSGIAPAASTTAPGVLNMCYNETLGSVYAIAYCNYTELPIGEHDYSGLPGAFISNTSFLYYNKCGYDCYMTVQSGWMPGTEPTVQHIYIQSNSAGRNCYINMGENTVASTFAMHFTATAVADTAITNRRTVVLSSALTAAQAAVIVGMNVMFENAHTSASNAGNFTGTTKTVTAYDADTRTITLSADFNQSRPYNTTIRFFYNTNNTKIWYGTNTKIARMINYVHAKELPCGILVADGTVLSNNLSNGRKIADIDAVNQVITLSSGLAGIAWRNANAWVCTQKAPNTVGDLASSLTSTGGVFKKIAAAQIESNGDLMATDYRRCIVGCKITGPAITTGTSREIIKAEYSTVSGQENRLIITMDGDDSLSVNTATLVEYVIRRIPGFGIQGVNNNVLGGSAYVLLGSWGQTENGQLTVQSPRMTYNNIGGSCYIESRNYFGVNPNANSGLITRNAYIAYNTVATSCYIEFRSNRDAGGIVDDSVSLYYNTVAADCFIRLSPRMHVQRMINLYRNECSYRLLVNISTSINGTTIGKTTAPMIRGGINIYGNNAPWIFVNSMYVNQGSLVDTGLASLSYGLRFSDNKVGRARIESASNWIDLHPLNTRTVTDPAAAIWLERQDNYEADFNPVVTLPTSQEFAYLYRALNCRCMRISTSTPADKYLFQGEVSGLVINNVPATIENNIWRVNPDPGTIISHAQAIGPDVYLWHNKKLLSDA